MTNISEITKQWAEQKNCKYFHFDEIASTNAEAKKQGHISTTSPWIYIADTQSEGRGRRQNTWTSPEKGSALLTTWCYKLNGPAQPITSPLFGWAVYKALNDEFDMPLSIKAPNDIYSGPNKIAGLLTESVSQGDIHCVYVGLGLNVNAKPNEIPNSTCVSDEIGSPMETERFQRFLENLYVNFSEAAKASPHTELAGSHRTEILTALKKWPENKVTNILSNANLILEDNTRVSWMDL